MSTNQIAVPLFWPKTDINDAFFKSDFITEKILEDNMSDSTSILPLNDDQIWTEENPPDSILFSDETEDISRTSSVTEHGLEKDLNIHELNAEKLAEMAKKMAQNLLLIKSEEQEENSMNKEYKFTLVDEKKKPQNRKVSFEIPNTTGISNSNLNLREENRTLNITLVRKAPESSAISEKPVEEILTETPKIFNKNSNICGNFITDSFVENKNFNIISMEPLIVKNLQSVEKADVIKCNDNADDNEFARKTIQKNFSETPVVLNSLEKEEPINLEEYSNPETKKTIGDKNKEKLANSDIENILEKNNFVTQLNNGNFKDIKYFSNENKEFAISKINFIEEPLLKDSPNSNISSIASKKEKEKTPTTPINIEFIEEKPCEDNSSLPLETGQHSTITLPDMIEDYSKEAQDEAEGIVFVKNDDETLRQLANSKILPVTNDTTHHCIDSLENLLNSAKNPEELKKTRLTTVQEDAKKQEEFVSNIDLKESNEKIDSSFQKQEKNLKVANNLKEENLSIIKNKKEDTTDSSMPFLTQKNYSVIPNNKDTHFDKNIEQLNQINEILFIEEKASNKPEIKTLENENISLKTNENFNQEINLKNILLPAEYNDKSLDFIGDATNREPDFTNFSSLNNKNLETVINKSSAIKLNDEIVFIEELPTLETDKDSKLIKNSEIVFFEEPPSKDLKMMPDSVENHQIKEKTEENFDMESKSQSIIGKIRDTLGTLNIEESSKKNPDMQFANDVDQSYKKRDEKLELNCKINDSAETNFKLDEYERRLRENTREALELVDRLCEKTQQQSNNQRRDSQNNNTTDSSFLRNANTEAISSNSNQIYDFSNLHLDADSFRLDTTLLKIPIDCLMLPNKKLVILDDELGILLINLNKDCESRVKRRPPDNKLRNAHCTTFTDGGDYILILAECNIVDSSESSPNPSDIVEKKSPNTEDNKTDDEMKYKTSTNWKRYICRFDSTDLRLINRVEAPKYIEEKVVTRCRICVADSTKCIYLAVNTPNLAFLYELSAENKWTEIYSARQRNFADINTFAVVGPVTELLLIETQRDYVQRISVYNSNVCDQKMLAICERPDSLTIDSNGNLFVYDRATQKIGHYNRLYFEKYRDVALVERAHCQISASNGLLAVLSRNFKELKLYRY